MSVSFMSTRDSSEANTIKASPLPVYDLHLGEVLPRRGLSLIKTDRAVYSFQELN